MKILIPVMLAVLGAGAGAGAGYLVPLDPSHLPLAHATEGETAIEMLDNHTEPTKIVKLSNQFIIPVIEDDGESALVIMSLSLEVTVEKSQSVFDLEPRLRDGIMKVLFDHSSHGGFSGRYYSEDKMAVLRKYLLQSAQDIMGGGVQGVLITDLVRQAA
ncbi:flagellar basal body-associated FliL family protein [Donghicola sp. C2-DW-16]|uniref:Flagellar protein FliL n=1 Tax=Donghicola mangrovi TaxID=2729614 RepID=A0ABX2P9Z4_9RHOB|nr:flagellar basal body-associated FliL family protein [Donghicola mangrovi]NVO25970.1 flagellar basal body-associated FliL family protein [Donghicola mangrovi]